MRTHTYKNSEFKYLIVGPPFNLLAKILKYDLTSENHERRNILSVVERKGIKETRSIVLSIVNYFLARKSSTVGTHGANVDESFSGCD